MADTNDTQAPEGYTPLSPDQKSQWNGFASYLGKQNVGPELDENPGLGHAYMQQYANKTPDFTLTPDHIPHIQYEQQQLRSGSSPIAALGNDSYYSRKTSAPNGEINSLTANSFYPTVATRDSRGKVVTDYGTDVDKFMAENPGAIAKGGGKKAKTAAAPASGTPGAAPTAPGAPDPNPWAGKNAIPIARKDATGTTLRPATVANFRGPGGTQKDSGLSSLGGTDQPVVQAQQEDTGPYKQLSDAYRKTNDDYQTSLDQKDAVDYSGGPTVKVTGGKDPGINVPVQLIKDIATTAKKNGYDPYIALAQASQESSFGADTGDQTAPIKNKRAILQAHDLDEPYRPHTVEQYMENHGVPGVKAIPDRYEGQKYIVTDQKVLNDYLTAHPEVMKSYQDHLQKHAAIPADYDTYSAAVNRDKTGIKNYNADPKYAQNLQKYSGQLRGDKNVKQIVESL